MTHDELLQRARELAARRALVVIEHVNGYTYHGRAGDMHEDAPARLVVQSTTSEYTRAIQIDKMLALHEWHPEDA